MRGGGGEGEGKHVGGGAGGRRSRAWFDLRENNKIDKGGNGWWDR